ncbi:MAG TPA: hypothetical protein VKU39_18390, partial [Streptosporangiaceae bacterium]|nr:hypothetical protein [Streptosporangiaceae bacterium]
RRTLLRTGAAAGAAGIAAGSLGVAAVTSGASSSGASSAGAASADSAGAPAASGQDPIVLHVRDARTGEVEIFTGSTVVRVRDSVITSRISSAL